MTILFIAVLFVCGALLRVLTLRRGVRDIRYDLQFSTLTAEPGERFKLITTIENTGPLPSLFLGTTENLPYDIDLEGDGRTSVVRIIQPADKYARLDQTTYLMPHQRLTRTLGASLPVRGQYTVRSARVTGGDLLGFSQTMREESLYREIVIFPESLRPPELTKVFGSYLGEQSVRRFILEDPVLTMGFREYTGAEPMKNISWQRSLRDNRLMVKQFDYTMELTATILLNMEHAPDVADEVLERTFSLTRGVCEELESRHTSYTLITNAAAGGRSGYWSSVGDGMGRLHMNAILEGLGRSLKTHGEPLNRLLGRIGRGVQQGRAYILLTPGIPESARAALTAAKNRLGGALLVLDTTKEADEWR